MMYWTGIMPLLCPSPSRPLLIAPPVGTHGRKCAEDIQALFLGALFSYVNMIRLGISKYPCAFSLYVLTSGIHVAKKACACL
jgi:hypothetical protein